MSDFDSAFRAAARANPAPPPRPRYVESTGDYLMGWVKLILVLFGVLVLYILFGPKKPLTEADRMEAAYYAATQIVKDKLKTPSTATFETFRPTMVRRDAGAYVVRGWVEAQNSFGAPIRADWLCTLREVSNERLRGDCAISD